MTQTIPKLIVDACSRAYDVNHKTGACVLDDLVKDGSAVKYKYGEHLGVEAGNFLGSTRNKKGELICYKLKEYYHSLTVASTGLGKTQTYILPSIMNLTGKESAVIVGPKGEEVLNTYNYVSSVYGKKNVEILNFTNPKHTSVYYNPLYTLADRYVKSYELTFAKRKAEQEDIFCELQKLINETFPVRTSNDISWDIGARAVIEAIAIGCICDCSEHYLKLSPINKSRGIRRKLLPEEVNFKTILDIFTQFSWVVDGGSWGDKGFFTERKDNLAKEKAQTAMGATGSGTRSSYLSLTSSFLIEHVNSKVLEISKYNTLDFSSYQEKPKVLYITYDMSDDVIKTWVNDVVRNFIVYLNDRAINSEMGKLKIKTLFYLDEFTALKEDRIYPKILSIGRGAGIFLNLCIQSFSQLESIYEKDKDTIIENCNVKYFMGSNHASSVKKFMEEIGNVSRPSKEQMFYGKIAEEEKPRVSFEKLMFGMQAGDCYVKTLYKAPAYVRMCFFYNTPEYREYKPFNILLLKPPKITLESSTQSSSNNKTETFDEEEKLLLELKRIQMELRRKEILRKMQIQIEEESNYTEEDEEE